jgi:SAM-dependent methyltransferase
MTLRAGAKRGRHRRNLLEGVQEYFRPPAITRSATRRQQGIAEYIRTLLDLQYGSIRNDLKYELPSARGTVLDAGCGAQPFRWLLPEGVKYIGIDIVDAKEKFGYTQPDTLYYDGKVWPIESTSVDFVLSTETLEHVIEPASFLAEAHRCLKPGGRLLLTVPFAARWHFIPNDYWRFTPSGIEHLLSKAGFEEIKVFGRGNSVTVACHKAMTLYLGWAWLQGKSVLLQVLSTVIALILSPVFLLLAAIANVSFAWDGGNDYLGLTVTARAGRAALNGVNPAPPSTTGVPREPAAR